MVLRDVYHGQGYLDETTGFPTPDSISDEAAKISGSFANDVVLGNRRISEI